MPKGLGQPPQPRGVPVTGGGAGGRLLDHPGSDLELDRHVLAGLDPFGELAAPGLEVVDPTLDREQVAAQLGDRELGLPAIVDERGHRDLDPRRGPPRRLTSGPAPPALPPPRAPPGTPPRTGRKHLLPASRAE